MIPTWRGTAAVVMAAVTSAVLGAGCAGDDDLDLGPPRDTVDLGAPGNDGSSTRPGAPFHVAQASGSSLDVRSAPQENAEVVRTLVAGDQVSGLVVCLVAQELGDNWVEVYLPTGEPGSTGWIERDDVTLTRHHFRIEVALEAHSLRVYSGDDVLVSAPVAVGPDAPGAGDRFFITDLVRPPNPAGVYGAYAYGLSGSDNDLAAFAAADGVVALHGTADPSTLGTDTDRGAIAVDPAVIANLVDTVGLPLGTPVDVLE
jgi:lipoprotein-anchoring transpeptidase ErfK/SrfK